MVYIRTTCIQCHHQHSEKQMVTLLIYMYFGWAQRQDILLWLSVVRGFKIMDMGIQMYTIMYTNIKQIFNIDIHAFPLYTSTFHLLYVTGVDPGSGERGSAGRITLLKIHGKFKRFFQFLNFHGQFQRFFCKYMYMYGRMAGAGVRPPCISACYSWCTNDFSKHLGSFQQWILSIRSMKMVT
jgi:hypothetical protein